MEARLVKVLNQEVCDQFAIYNADCIEVVRALPSESVGLTVTSIPYGNLYVYTATPRDIGNSKDDAQFWAHFQFLIPELLRVTKRGRLCVIDVMNIPAMKERDGYIGLKDLRGDVIRAFVGAGFIFHSEHCMWKDPLIEAVRSKSLGLMHKQLMKDSTMSRAGIPQYLLAFRKPGTNPEPVAHEQGLDSWSGENPPKTGNPSHERWRRYASPVWMDIDFTRTLNAAAAREEEDEKHVCPFSLDIVERALWLWSNPGDIVLDPFAGIASTGVVALEMGRKPLLVELKTSYFEQAVKNLRAAQKTQTSLFAS
jgi:DNA modification methylase